MRSCVYAHLLLKANHSLRPHQLCFQRVPQLLKGLYPALRRLQTAECKVSQSSD